MKIRMLATKAEQDEIVKANRLIQVISMVKVILKVMLYKII